MSIEEVLGTGSCPSMVLQPQVLPLASQAGIGWLVPKWNIVAVRPTNTSEVRRFGVSFHIAGICAAMRLRHFFYTGVPSLTARRQISSVPINLQRSERETVLPASAARQHVNQGSMVFRLLVLDIYRTCCEARDVAVSALRRFTHN